MKTGTAGISSLVIGVGEVGTAIASILECEGIDRGQVGERKSYTFLHICFPYSTEFIDQVRKYQELYSPDYTIIHSTVPLGTSRKVDAVHSPVRGIHPELEKGIRTFVKYFGGKDAGTCAEIFKDKGMSTTCLINQEETEALKLWDTTIYGLNILIEKEMHAYCAKYGLDFEMVYTNANKTYNEGYEKLGHPEYKKYILKHVDGKIGGHCVTQNAALLDSGLATLLCE